MGFVSGFLILSVMLTTFAVCSSQELKYDKTPSNRSKYLRIHRSRLNHLVWNASRELLVHYYRRNATYTTIDFFYCCVESNNRCQ